MSIHVPDLDRRRLLTRAVGGVGLAALSGSVLAACGASSDQHAAPPRPTGPSEFITLGTGAGPSAQTGRAQPANLLRSGDHHLLVDLGDGIVDQLEKVDIGLNVVGSAFVSHLHFDHVAGLFGVLSRRYQMGMFKPLTIYGPPGIASFVTTLLDAVGRFAPADVRLRAGAAPSNGLTVTEIHDGERVTVEGIPVTAAANSHYASVAGNPASAGELSLAFRFDLPDRSIVYTGDTGPSANVEKLARGADLLVSEIADVATAVDGLRGQRPDISATELTQFENHMRLDHLASEDVGSLAQRAEVKSVVLTHNAVPAAEQGAARQAITTHFSGSVRFADDLNRF
ncbi:MBL fold metallo-hydrolase [Nocardia sp. NPDC003482]